MDEKKKSKVNKFLKKKSKKCKKMGKIREKVRGILI
jgi:hypothetical protein